MKKRIIEVVVIIVCVLSLILIFKSMKKSSTDYIEDSNNNTITFIVVDELGNTVINDKISYTEGETLYNILDRSYTLVTIYTVGIGHAILEINEYKTDWYNNYFALYYDGIYASHGVDNTYAKKDMEVKFIWTSLN